MAASKKKAKKASGKKRTSKKSVEPVQSSASTTQAELEELRAMRSELAEGLKELNKGREDLKREQDLARINSAGKPPTIVQDTVEQQRQKARDERRRKRQQEREQASAQPPTPVSSIDEARARKKKADSKPKEPITLPMNELHKYKLASLNHDYADAMKKVKEPLIPKYNQMLEAEAKELVQRDEGCVAAHRAQVECINELVKLLDDQLPEGYAITQLLTEKSVIVAQYVPDRAGKPLPLPEMTGPEGG